MHLHETQAKSMKACRHSDAESHSLCLVALHSGSLVATQFKVFAKANGRKRPVLFWNRPQPNQNAWLPHGTAPKPGPEFRRASMPHFCTVNASPKMLFTTSFTSPFTRRHNLALSSERAYLRSKDGSRTLLKHRLGLERPHFVVAEAATVAPAQVNSSLRRSLQLHNLLFVIFGKACTTGPQGRGESPCQF